MEGPRHAHRVPCHRYRRVHEEALQGQMESHSRSPRVKETQPQHQDGWREKYTHTLAILAAVGPPWRPPLNFNVVVGTVDFLSRRPPPA